MNVSPINNTNRNNKPSFGMAFYHPTYEELATKVGKKFADEFEKAKPQIKELVKDVDLDVSFFKSFSDGEEILGSEVICTAVEKLPKNWFEELFYRFKIKTPEKISVSSFSSRRDDTAEKMINHVKSSKRIVNEWLEENDLKIYMPHNKQVKN